MKHFYNDSRFSGPLDGQMWFTYPKLYLEAILRAQDGAHFVEVGTWKGRSAAFMIVEIINSGKSIKFDCVDTWLGSKVHHDQPQNYTKQELNELYNTFINNMKEVEGHYTAHKMTSVEASKLYENASLDFVFIDACHEEESVYNDIIHWLPKMKSGSLFAGHDAPDPGVIAALTRCINSGILNASNFRGTSELCWIYEVP
jgi:hypothetical protein